MEIKKKIRFLHKWLGLTSGLIVFIVSITGCIFCFHDEIKDLTRDYRKVEIQEKSFILPSKLQQNAKKLFPDATADMVVFYGKDRPAIVYASIKEKAYNLYFNPYSGEFLKQENIEKDFFAIIEDLHMHLWLPEAVGKQVVGISTIIFILMLFSGIVLWWPKKRKDLKNRIKIKWNAKWRRVNYDWHNVTGFYISIFVLIIALTGLTFSYEWMHKMMNFIGNLGQDYPEYVAPVIDSTFTSTSENPMDISISQAYKMKPNDEMFFVWYQGEKSPIITGSYPDAMDFDHQSNLHFHPKTGELLSASLYENKNPGMKLQEMNYGLHTGQYFGLTGKIIAFILSLFAAALPVTGFIIFWGRRNKKSKK